MHAVSPDWLSVDEVARELHAGRRQVEQWCASGDLPAEQSGRTWRIASSWRTGSRGAVLAILVGSDIAQAANDWT